MTTLDFVDNAEHRLVPVQDDHNAKETKGISWRKMVIGNGTQSLNQKFRTNGRCQTGR